MTRLFLALVVVLCLMAGSGPGAQVRPVYDLGAAGLLHVLGRLQTTASALHTGAHPDDEDSAFIARTARGDHARTAYLSLNRGEGGQNIIGTELFDALGVIRTEELLQARRLDGGEQFFTRAFDYGFSKSPAEASAKWDVRLVLDDMVRVIRRFRPLVVYSRFAGDPSDDHGHHQLAGALTPLAITAAADPAQYPQHLAEGLRPWQVRKYYRRPVGGDGPRLRVDTGTFDPVVGRSFAEIALEGRSQHKSQQMGTIETRGPVVSTLERADARDGSSTTETAVFDGIDTSVAGLAALAGLPPGTLRNELAAMADAARQALERYHPRTPAEIVPALAAGLRATRAARAALAASTAGADARAEADFLLAFKEHDFSTALVRAAGLVVDPLADDDTVTPGASVAVRVRVFLPERSPVALGAMTVRAPAGWTTTPAVADREPGGGRGFRRETPTHEAGFQVAVPANAALTQPYYLGTPRTGDAYRWSETDPKTLPFAPPLLAAEVTATIGGETVRVSEPVVYRYADRVRGELRRDVNVVPPVAVGLDTNLLVVPLGTTPHRQRIVVRARSFSSRPVAGTLRLRLPAGWTAEPADERFSLSAEGDSGAATFVVTAPARRTAGRVEIGAEALVDGVTFAQDVQVIAYPHIQTHRVYMPAVAAAQVIDLEVAAVKVGYIMGSGDQVPDALRRMGVDVTLLDDDTLATGDLGRFDTIVVGVRASEARPAFVANNGRLHAYMERGGTLIVQYQQLDYLARRLTPYPATAPDNSRVTDERAPVRMLAPTHPVLSFPNRIAAADFDGWVQERNLYAFTTFDPRYTPLLETQDPGEAPQQSGELYAEVGRGRYVYTAYSWFRQLPAGVPGAYRQMANLISLSKAPR